MRLGAIWKIFWTFTHNLNVIGCLITSLRKLSGGKSLCKTPKERVSYRVHTEMDKLGVHRVGVADTVGIETSACWGNHCSRRLFKSGTWFKHGFLLIKFIRQNLCRSIWCSLILILILISRSERERKSCCSEVRNVVSADTGIEFHLLFGICRIRNSEGGD